MKVKNLILCLVVLSMVVMVPVLAKGPTKQSGSSQMAHLYLYEKNPVTWEIIPDGKWGKVSYTWENETLDLVCNAHGYAVDDLGEEYCLIYYPDPWPGTGLICLGSGVVEEEPVYVLDEYGEPTDVIDHYEYNIHIESKGILQGSLPILGDLNNPEAKIWLVPSLIVDCDPDGGTSMIGWDPTNILFEEDTVVFVDTDGLPI